MDSLRSQDGLEPQDDAFDFEAIEAPPIIDADERRMQVRAYNYWVSLIGDRSLPSIEDLNPEQLADFSAYSVLLDFSLGLENPAIVYLGSSLREQCDIDGTITHIADVPSRSLLSRLTDHYLQIIANAAPVGFEAEFTNQRGVPILYRGILMPFSSDDQTIDFIYGVINWKEVADQAMLRDLDAEVQAALQDPGPAYPRAPIWADGPSATADFEDEDEEDAPGVAHEVYETRLTRTQTAPDVAGTDRESAPQEAEDELDLSAFLSEEPLADAAAEGADGADMLEEPLDLSLDAVVDEASDDELILSEPIADGLSDSPEPVEPAEAEPAFAAADTVDAPLAAMLDRARRSASEAQDRDSRSHTALYAAIGEAYDFALGTRAAPEDYAALLADAGIAVQERSPMTAVVKLIFGADYDKTRIAEYALALDHALAEDLPQGALAAYILAQDGGLKGLVKAIRAVRRAAKAADAAPRGAKKLDRAKSRLSHARPADATALPFDENGLALVVARREEGGGISLLAGLSLDDSSAQKAVIAASKTLSAKAD